MSRAEAADVFSDREYSRATRKAQGALEAASFKEPITLQFYSATHEAVNVAVRACRVQWGEQEALFIAIVTVEPELDIQAG